MNIWLVRHGETEWNLAGRLQGRTDVPLDEKGRRQAGAARDFILSKDIDFDCVFASPLSRALETAEIISGEDPARIRTDDRLIEAGFGIFEGKTWDQLKHVPIRTIRSLRPFAALTGVESRASLENRAKSFLNELSSEPRAEASDILVVSHGGFLRIMRGQMEGHRPTFSRNCELFHYRCQNGAYLYVENHWEDIK